MINQAIDMFFNFIEAIPAIGVQVLSFFEMEIGGVSVWGIVLGGGAVTLAAIWILKIVF